jgi:stage III sporulation protein AB
MMLKLLGAMLVLIGAGGLGVYYGLGCKHRKGELEQLRRAFRIMYSETEFGHTPLAVMCDKALAVCDDEVGKIFEEFREVLQNKATDDISTLWKNCVEKGCIGTYMKDEDIQALSGLGSCLGVGDISLQLAAIERLIAYIDDKCSELDKASEKNMRLCRSTGVLTGIFVVILLF